MILLSIWRHSIAPAGRLCILRLQLCPFVEGTKLTNIWCVIPTTKARSSCTKPQVALLFGAERPRVLSVV